MSEKDKPEALGPDEIFIITCNGEPLDAVFVDTPGICDIEDDEHIVRYRRADLPTERERRLVELVHALIDREFADAHGASVVFLRELRAALEKP